MLNADAGASPRRSAWESRLLAAFSGLLLGAAFPPVPTGITAFIGFLPLLVLLRGARSAAQAFRWSYITFLFFNFATVYWISGWSGKDIWLMISGIVVNLFHPLLFCVPMLLYFRTQRKFGYGTALLFLPVVWTAYEWAAQLSELSFPWLMLGNTQSYNIESIQFISATGVYGASFWIVAVNALCAYWMFGLLEGRWRIASRATAARALVLILFLLAPRLASLPAMRERAAGPVARVGISQPDIDPYDKWGAGTTPGAMLDNLLRQYDSLAPGKPDLILFPETAIPFRILTPLHEEEKMRLERKVDSAGVPLLTGFPDLRYYEEGKAPPSAKKFPGTPIRYDDYNAAMLLLPHRFGKQIYRKIKLTPMSERIPYLDCVPFLADALSWGVGISNWGIGRDTTLFTLPLARTPGDTARFWSMICYETLYPEFVSRFVRKGADFLVVITNDGWFGNTSGPYQLEQYAVLRAIENRRAVARCANNGISCFIDPWGRVSGKTTMYTRRTLAGEVPRVDTQTFYTRHGDWFPRICAGLAAVLLLGTFFAGKKHGLDRPAQ